MAIRNLSLLMLVLLFSACTHKKSIPHCSERKLPTEVDALTAPIIRQSRSWTERERFKTEQMLEDLNKMHSPAAMEARIVLLAHYFGAHQGEDLLCAVVADGVPALSFLEKYQNCASCSAEWPFFHRHIEPVLHSVAIEMINAGKKC